MNTIQANAINFIAQIIRDHGETLPPAAKQATMEKAQLCLNEIQTGLVPTQDKSAPLESVDAGPIPE